MNRAIWPLLYVTEILISYIFHKTRHNKLGSRLIIYFRFMNWAMCTLRCFVVILFSDNCFNGRMEIYLFSSLFYCFIGRMEIYWFCVSFFIQYPPSSQNSLLQDMKVSWIFIMWSLPLHRRTIVFIQTSPV